MIRLLFLTLIPIPFFTQGQIGPVKISDYEVGTTTINDLQKLTYSSGGYSYKQTSIDLIKDDEEYDYHSKFPDDSFYISSKLFEISPVYKDKMFSKTALALTTDSNRTFFIDQLEIGETQKYVVNNIVLYFYDDTLTKLTYDIPMSTSDILFEKYKGQGINRKVKSETSKCTLKLKNGQRFKNTVTTYQLINLVPKIYSTISLYSIVDSDCNLTIYNKVEIWKQETTLLWLDRSYRYLVKKKAELRDQTLLERENAKSKF